MSQEQQLNFYRPKYRDQNGFLMPMGFPEEQFQPSLEYKPADSDIFIATYPKCGTTWMQYIVYLLKNKGTVEPRFLDNAINGNPPLMDNRLQSQIFLAFCNAKLSLDNGHAFNGESAISVKNFGPK